MKRRALMVEKFIRRTAAWSVLVAAVTALLLACAVIGRNAGTTGPSSQDTVPSVNAGSTLAGQAPQTPTSLDEDSVDLVPGLSGLYRSLGDQRPGAQLCRIDLK